MSFSNGCCALLVQFLATVFLMSGSSCFAKAQNSVDDLVKTVANPDKSNFTKTAAVRKLASMGSGAKSAIPTIRPLMESNDRALKSAAINFFGKVGKEAVPPLLEAMKKEPAQNSSKVEFLLAIGNYGTDAKEAVPALIEIVETDQDSSAITQALVSLGKIKSKPDDTVKCAISAISQGLSINQKSGRSLKYGVYQLDAAFGVLKSLGPDAKSSVPFLKTALEQFLRKGESNWALKALTALKAIGPDARDAAPLVRMYLKHPTLGNLAEQTLEAINK